MSACLIAEPVVIGDSVSLAFLVRDAGGSIMDVQDVVFTGRIVNASGEVLLTMTEGDRINIENVLPDEAADPDDQQPHGTIDLSEADTALLALGAMQWLILRMAFDGKTDTMQPRALRGIEV